MKHQQAWLPSGFPTLKKPHHFHFSLLLTLGCTGIKDPVNNLKKNSVYYEWCQFLQSQIIYFFSKPGFSVIVFSRNCHKFKHNIKFLNTKKFAAFLSVSLNFKQKVYLFWENKKAQVTKKVDREKCICRLAHCQMIWIKKGGKIFWFKILTLPVNDIEKKELFWPCFHIMRGRQSWQIYKLSNSRPSASRAWRWDWQSCHFIHWQKSLNISKYWKTSLKVTPASMTLTSKYGFILFSHWNRQDQWCSACQRWPYWLVEMMWLEFLQKDLESVLFLHTILSFTGKESNSYSNSNSGNMAVLSYIVS